MFNIYIYDYCFKRGFRKTAQELMNEGDLGPDPTPPINARQGLLFECVAFFFSFLFLASIPDLRASQMVECILGPLPSKVEQRKLGRCTALHSAPKHTTAAGKSTTTTTRRRAIANRNSTSSTSSTTAAATYGENGQWHADRPPTTTICLSPKWIHAQWCTYTTRTPTTDARASADELCRHGSAEWYPRWSWRSTSAATTRSTSPGSTTRDAVQSDDAGRPTTVAKWASSAPAARSAGKRA